MFRPVMLLQCLVILVASSWLIEALPQPNNAGLTSRNAPDIITGHGFPVETHHVTTEDGYILGMHRIPYGRSGPSEQRRPPVFLMHGLLAASSSYLAIGPEYSIGFNLADAGFDVWMGNARGSRYSRSHVTLDPDGEEDKFKFFDFTWEEIGYYDVASMTDYVREYTGFEKIHYIGHSQGTTVFFILNIMRPEYNQNFASAHLLAPVSYKKHFPNPLLSAVAVFTDTIYSLGVSNGLVEIGQNILDALEINNGEILSTDFWTTIVREIRGANTDTNRYPRDLEMDPSMFGGGSLKQIAHYGQNVRSSNFQRWDFGLLENREVYGTLRPPLYDLSRVTVESTLHYTVADNLAGVEDVLEMERVLPNGVARRLTNEEFSHAGFAMDPEVKELVTDYVIERLKAAENLQ